MTAPSAVMADRYQLRCANPRHLDFGRVVASCNVREPLEAYLTAGHPTCLALVDTASTDGGHADADR